MSRYDWSWNRSYDRGFRPRPMRGYGPDFAGYGPAWRGGRGAPWQWGTGSGRGWGGPPPRQQWQRPRYDRGEYGDFYPTYGGYPGDRSRGMYYGGESRPGGYDREPFLPESAYERHPELDQPNRHSFDDWPAAAQPAHGTELSDEEIRSAVRQNLFNDNWIDAGRIQVEVSGKVVTLTGEVDDYLEARYAWDDAWEAPGVRGVVNQLTVRTEPTPAEPPTKTPSRRAAR